MRSLTRMKVMTVNLTRELVLHEVISIIYDRAECTSDGVGLCCGRSTDSGQPRVLSCCKSHPGSANVEYGKNIFHPDIS